MGTTADKLNKILDSKVKIKAAIEAKGVTDVGDILANYPDKIASIQSGGGSSGFTGHADVEGLKAIGWTDEDIEYYQTHGVNWNEEEDAYHKVPQDNIDLYGVVNATNIKEYRDRIVYLPKIDTSGITDMTDIFSNCYSLICIPQLDTSSVTSMKHMFSHCYSLICIPQLDTSSVTDMLYMFNQCHSLISIPQLDMSNVIVMNYMFASCYSLVYIPQLDTSSVTDMLRAFVSCYSLTSIAQLNVGGMSNIGYTFDYCYSIQTANLKGLKKSATLDKINLLSKESLLYIINNEVVTKSAIITLSAYCYNKYNADPDIVAALANHPNISLASA